MPVMIRSRLSPLFQWARPLGLLTTSNRATCTVALQNRNFTFYHSGKGVVSVSQENQKRQPVSEGRWDRTGVRSKEPVC